MSAVCLRQDKPGRVFVRTLKGRGEEKLQDSKALFVMPGFISPNASYDDIDEALSRANRKREEMAAGVNISELWELICDEPADKLWSLEELCELVFGEATPLELSALYRVLEGDRTYLLRKGEEYLVRSAEQVKDNLYNQQKAEEFKVEREELCRWITSLWRQVNPCTEVNLPAGCAAAAERAVESLKDVALLGMDSHRYREVQNLLSEVKITRRNAAFDLLVKAGVWSKHENLTLLRLNLPQEFPLEVEEEAQKLSDGLCIELSEGRRDLRDWPCVTIDDAVTLDLDDAISYEVLPNGNRRVGVHIADVSECIPEGSLVDQEAFERSTSIYLPDLRISMVPVELAHGRCSLVVDQDRLAFSFIAEFDEDANIVDSQITPALIRVKERLTYEDADRYLSEERWPGLGKLVEQLRGQRQAQGASLVPFPRIQVKVSPEGEILVSRESPSQPAQKLVSEMMILANRLGAEALFQAGFPAIYRAQTPPEQPIEMLQGEYDPVQAYACRRFMHRGTMSVEPAPHSGLGLEHYVQVTSPIRRYNDLMLQRQLRALCAGKEPHYTSEQLDQKLMITKERTRQAELLEKERRNYWLLCYLESKEHQEMEAVVVANHPDKHIIQLVETLLETDCALVPHHPLAPGEHLWVRVDQVWPRDNIVNVSAIVGEE